VVKRATHRRSNDAVAVKILRLPAAMAALLPPGAAPPTPGAPPEGAPPLLAECPASDLDEEDILKEVLILRGLDSPHVLRLREYFLAPERGVIYLVTELMLGGQLLDALLAQADGVYGERDARAAFTAVRCAGAWGGRGMRRLFVAKKGTIVRACVGVRADAYRAPRAAAAARPALAAHARHHTPRRQGAPDPPSHTHARDHNHTTLFRAALTRRCAHLSLSPSRATSPAGQSAAGAPGRPVQRAAG
jgi:hypothetical protein